MLRASHFQEWLASGVDPAIIELNVESLSGDAAYEALLYGLPDSERLNNGRLSSGWLRKYSHLEDGGWFCSGVDVITHKASGWGCLKPNTPRIDLDGMTLKQLGELAKKQGINPDGWDKSQLIRQLTAKGQKSKQIKYETPPKVATEIFALRVSYGIGLKIAEKQGLKDDYLARLGDSLDSEDQGFWAWVINHPQIPICLSEGAKKAGSLLSASYVGISLPGIFNGYRQPKDEMGQPTGPAKLIPQLEAFCQNGREVIFAFDQDEKPKTIRNVQIAIQKTGKLLEDQGCKVSIVRWDKSHKGVDDFIVSQSVEAFDQVYKKRISLEKFNLEIGKAIGFEKWQKFHTFTAKEKINQRYLEIDPPKQGEILIINSPTNTGKSTLLKKWAKNDFADKGIIRVGNRNSLELQFCNESDFRHLQTDSMLSDTLLSDPKKRVSFCFPSLTHTSSKHWENTVIYGDEIDGTIQQALFLNKDPDNLDRFKQALELCDRGVFLSGTLYDHHIDYLKALCPTKTFRIIQNTYTPQRPKIKLLAGTFKDENPDKIDSRDKSPLLDRILSDSEPTMIQSDSKHFLGSLERLIKIIPNTDTLLVTADTLIADKKVKEFIENPNGYIKEYSDKNPTRRLVVLASPTMTSGNDITIKYFKRDYHYYCGNLSSVLISQKIIRIRDIECERYISLPEYVTSDDTEKCRYLEQWQNLMITATVNLLDAVEKKSQLIKKVTDSLESPHYQEASISKVIRDFERSNYRDCVTKLLTMQGYEIELIIEGESESCNTEKLKEVSEEIKQETSEAIYQASDKFVGKDEASIEPETKDDLMAVEKAKIVSQLPDIHESESWSSELVRLVKYDKPRLIQQLNRRYLLHNPDTLKKLTAKRYHRHAQRLTTKRFGPHGKRLPDGKTIDIWRDKHHLLFLTAVEKIGVKGWLEDAIKNNTQFTNSDPAVTEIITKCQNKGISMALGRKPGKDPIKFLSWLLGTLGYALGKKRVRVGESREYQYSIKEACQNAQFLSEIGDAIERRYKSIMENCTNLDWGFLDEKITVKNPPTETDSNPDIPMVSAVLDQPYSLIKDVGPSRTESYYSELTTDNLNQDEIYLATDFLPEAARENSLLSCFKECLECVSRPKWPRFLAVIPISIKGTLLSLVASARQDSLINEFYHTVGECF